jgi:hypothetical protein
VDPYAFAHGGVRKIEACSLANSTALPMEVSEMTYARRLYQKCGELFDRYPLAIRPVKRDDGTDRAMVLLRQSGADVTFYVLLRGHGAGGIWYAIRPWRTDRMIKIGNDGAADIPIEILDAVTGGVPIPRDGSLFGWRLRSSVTAIIPIYAQYSFACPTPRWSIMPRVGTSLGQWPDFAGDSFFGSWFWNYCETGNIVSLAALIAQSPGVVFWSDTEKIIGSGCCIVTRNIKSPEGYTFRRGRYVHHQLLREGRPIPSLDVLLTDIPKADLAPRFEPLSFSVGSLQDSPKRARLQHPRRTDSPTSSSQHGSHGITESASLWLGAPTTEAWENRATPRTKRI